MPKFTHLHVHSHYSLLDGLPKIDELIDFALAQGMDSLAVTDHGSMYGAVEFYKKAKAKGLKPVIGSEMYLAPEGMLNKRPKIDDKRHHLVVLIKNKEGYENLVKLTTKAWLEGFYYKPRIDKELLKKHLNLKSKKLPVLPKPQPRKKKKLRFWKISLEPFNIKFLRLNFWKKIGVSQQPATLKQAPTLLKGLCRILASRLRWEKLTLVQLLPNLP